MSSRTRLGLIVTMGMWVASAAGAAELKVIVAAPLTGVMQDLAPRFERESGHRIIARFVSGPIVKREIDAGAVYDAAISITPVIDALIKEGKLQADSRADVAYALVGVGVRAGASKPDIGTVEAFKRALLNAKSVAHSQSGASGDHFKSIIERLGIADDMKSKLRPMPADAIAQAVPSGQAEMIVVTASVIMVPGTDFVGPLPAELQFYNRFTGAVGADAPNKDAARTLLNLMASPSAATVYKSHGMEQGVPK